MKVAMIGLGNMGTAVAHILSHNDHDVLGWDHFSEVVKEVNHARRNSRFLKGLELSPRVRATSDAEACVQESDAILCTIPTAYIRDTFTRIHDQISPSTPLVTFSKGLEKDTSMTARAILTVLFPDNSVVVLSGPTIAEDIVSNSPTCAALAGADLPVLSFIAKTLARPSFKLVFSTDPVRTEWGGVLKNIYAMGMGILKESGGTNLSTQASFFAKAFHEIECFMDKIGAVEFLSENTLGCADLIATSLSPASHHHRFGYLVAQGHSLDSAIKEMGTEPEGMTALRGVLWLAAKWQLPMPLASLIRETVYGNRPVNEFQEKFLS